MPWLAFTYTFDFCPFGIQRPPKLSLTDEASAKSVADEGRKQSESESERELARTNALAIKKNGIT